MDKVALVAQFIMLIAEPLAKLILNAASDTYDKDVELQSILQMQDKIAKARLERILQG